MYKMDVNTAINLRQSAADVTQDLYRSVVRNNEAQIRADRRFAQECADIVERTSKKPLTPPSKPPVQESKGLWHWLTKTTAGKWTTAGVAVAAITAGTWAYFTHNKKAENIDTLV